MIDITGVITPRASILNMLFGGTDVETIRSELGFALADSSVSKIVLNVDSPGGAVPGISELADLIYKAESSRAHRRARIRIGSLGSVLACIRRRQYHDFRYRNGRKHWRGRQFF